jgi:MarR family transcriptional regulator, organic hydroperoxide resistance regulator
MNPVTLDQFADRMEQLMPQFLRSVHRHEQNDLTRGVITMPQFWLLFRIRELGETSMQKLSDALELKLPSTSGLVDRLVRAGMLHRVRSRGDRRVVLVSLAPRGRKVVDQILRQRRSHTKRLFALLNSEERVAYLAIIEKIVTGLSNGRSMS